MNMTNPSHKDTRDTADEPPPPTRLILRKLTEARYTIPGHGEIHCRLWCMEVGAVVHRPPVYAVEMKNTGCSRMYVLGEDTVRAERIFRLLVRHTVTPCTLCDVLEEMD